MLAGLDGDERTAAERAVCGLVPWPPPAPAQHRLCGAALSAACSCRRAAQTDVERLGDRGLAARVAMTPIAAPPAMMGGAFAGPSGSVRRLLLSYCSTERATGPVPQPSKAPATAIPLQ